VVQNSTFNNFNQGLFGTAELSNGNVIWVWSGTTNGITSEIFGQVMTPNLVPVGGNFQISDNCEGSGVSPQVAALENNEFTVSWYQNNELYLAVYDENGKVIIPAAAKSPAFSTQIWGENFPSIIALSSCNQFMVGYTVSDPTTGNVRSFASHGAKVGDDLFFGPFCKCGSDSSFCTISGSCVECLSNDECRAGEKCIDFDCTDTDDDEIEIHQ